MGLAVHPTSSALPGCALQVISLTLISLKGGSIPIFDPVKTRDRPALSELKAKCDSTKPLAMFRSTETEFILCYESEWGVVISCSKASHLARPESRVFPVPRRGQQAFLSVELKCAAFGLYVDRHGEPNRDCQAIEWEGKPDSVAFHPPYLLLISAPFIEVRHIDNAKLLQIYTGSDIRLTWE